MVCDAKRAEPSTRQPRWRKSKVRSWGALAGVYSEKATKCAVGDPFHPAMIVYMKMLAVRLTPNQDLKTALEKIIKEKDIKSGYIATCVGSLHTVTMRLAGAKPEKQDIRTFDGHFEIVSLVGTVSTNGTHLHISVSDEQGGVVGGHLKEGSMVTTTAEVVIGYDESVVFNRVIDEETGFEELSVSKS